MIPRQPPPPPRLRATSKPDAEVPESVFHALQAVQAELRGVAQAVAVGAAASEQRFAQVESGLAKVSAAVRDRWTGLAKVVVPAVVTIVGAIIAARPTMPPPEIRAVKSLYEVRIEHECDPLPVRSQERFECAQRIYQETEARH